MREKRFRNIYNSIKGCESLNRVPEVNKLRHLMKDLSRVKCLMAKTTPRNPFLGRLQLLKRQVFAHPITS